MKTINGLTIALLLALLLANAATVQAQGNDPACGPFSPAAVEEIIATRGSAIQKFCPEYVVLGVAVAKTTNPLTRYMVEQITVMRGLPAEMYLGQNAFVVIPVTSSVHRTSPTVEEIREFIYMRGAPPTQAQIDRIIATRGVYHLEK